MSTKELIFPVGEVGEFKNYLPPEGMDFEMEMARVEAANHANYEYASRQPLQKLAGNSRISASFIYAHPPDYPGRPMLHCTVDQWREALRELKNMHIDTVIFQAALWRELNECYYSSCRYADLKQFHVLEPMLEAAALEKIHVYLGGYGSVAGWKKQFSSEALRQELAEHRACFRELTLLGKFDGMYFPCETAYHGEREPEKEQRMHTLYREFAAMVKEENTALKIITSPAGIFYPDKDAEFLDFWHNILTDTHIDILMPQDSVGNCSCNLGEIAAIWPLWRQIADTHQLELWSHTEVFERKGFTDQVNLFPAAPERVAHQLALTAPYVSRHCCWEALYFASRYAGEAGERLSCFLRSQAI